MKKIAIVLILGLILAMPMPVLADDIYPIVSVRTMVNPFVWSNLVTDMTTDISRNFTAVGRSNTTSAYIRIDFYDENNSLVESDYFSLSNFTIFSFRLVGDATSFDAVAENLGSIPIQVQFDLYNQTLENLEGMVFLISPNIYPTQLVNVTVTHTEYVLQEIPVPIITDFQAIMVGFGGFCLLIMYVMIKTKMEKEKPIKKLTLDDLLEDFRKG